MIVLHVAVSSQAYIAVHRRIRIETVNPCFYKARMDIGFMNRPNVTQATAVWKSLGVPCELQDTTFFLGHESLIASPQAPMALWRQKLFLGLVRNASNPAGCFGLPPNRVVELGAQVAF